MCMEVIQTTAASGSQISESDIQKAIDDYLQNVPTLFKKLFSGLPAPFEENYMFNVFGQEQYLLIAKFDFTTLPVKILKGLPVHLLKQFVVQVELDSLWYWALTHDIMISPAGHTFFDKWSLKEAFATLIAAHFAKLGEAPRNERVERLNRVIDEVVSESVKELVRNKDTITMYLCYPVLEGLVKFAMSPLVDPDGTARATLSDGRKSWRPGNQIRSLAELLRLLELNAAVALSNPDLGTNLKGFREQTELVMPPSQILPPYIRTGDGWDSIYQLRNVVLHGVKGWQLRSGLLTNLICLIIWHLMDDKRVSEELHNIATRPKHLNFPNWYYPPEL